MSGLEQTDRAVSRADVQPPGRRRAGARRRAAVRFDRRRAPESTLRTQSVQRRAARTRARGRSLRRGGEDARGLDGGASRRAVGASRNFSIHADFRRRGPAAASHRIYRARAARGIRSRTHPAARENFSRRQGRSSAPADRAADQHQLDLRAVLGRASRARSIARAGRGARAADRSRRRPGNPQRAAADRSRRRNRDHSARARSAAHFDRRRTPSLRNRAELSPRTASRERVERARAVRLHDDDAGGVRRSGAGDPADASRGEIAARRCDRVVRATRARSVRRRRNRASRRISRAPERCGHRRDRRDVEEESALI